MSERDEMQVLTCDEVREMAGAYVLGALDAAEAGAVRAHLVGHEDAHPEIAELGSVIPAFLETVPMVEPPAGLKDRIMAAAAADLAARGGASAAASGDAAVPSTSPPPALVTPAPAPIEPIAAASAPAAPARPVAFPTAEERAERRARTSTSGWLLRIAAVLAIAALGSWNLLLQNQLSAAQAYERNVAAVLDAAAEPGSLTAVLASEGTGSGLASVQADGDLAIAMRDLAPTAGSTVYEAWVIGADGVPVPVGNFRVGESGIGFLEAGGLPAAEGITLALTLEPGPGATTPTMPIISAGVAGAPG
jgi:anti-sigma-K factor RskA